jgi:hypothetical protein
VVLLNAVDGSGVTSAVVVAEIAVVLPEADDPGTVEEALPVVAVSVVAVVCDPSLAGTEELAPDEAELV